MPPQTTTTRSTDKFHEQPHTHSAFEFLAELLPTRNLTGEAIEDQAGDTKYHERSARTDRSETLFDYIARRLHRQQSPHLVLTGAKGIGRTAAVRELARRAANGNYPFLEDAAFLWFDCAAVGPEDSRNCLETLLTVAREQPDVVLCLSGFAALFPRPNGGTNGPLILTAARRPEVRIVGLMEPHEYQDLIASDVKLRDVFGSIELTEPEPGTTLKIALDAAEEIQQSSGQSLTSSAVDRAVVLSSSFLFQQAQPGKTIRILRQACEDACFEQTQLGQEPQPIGPERIDRVLEELTGIPASTFSGIADEIDYEEALSAYVVGQADAVDAVAGEMQLIKAGLVDPGKPASVMLFAGMTGVGKTELARRVAELYSGTRKLNVYTMGNFSEPHSVSGIIGVPPGYVGHEEGGRLINELNADPYAVFLLDEPAMLEITRLILAQIRRFWHDHRQKELVVEESLVEAIAAEAYRCNEKAGGKEGGRIIRKLIADLLERKIVEAWMTDKLRFQASSTIEVSLAKPRPAAAADAEGKPSDPPTLVRSEIRVECR